MRKRLEARQAAVNAALAASFRQEETLPQRTVLDAMRYSLLAGGKRLRPVLLLEFAAIGGLAEADALPFACALEMIHTYSLIHDDLPCMDDDDFRRGRPTCHRQFGEATALLAGDGLLTAAFERMLSVESAVSPGNRLAAAGEIALAAGCFGMIGGQALDLANWPDYMEVDRLKTGALFRAACKGGLLLAGERNPEKYAAAERFAACFGVSFQLQDDILDVIGRAETLGKPTGSDARQGRITGVGQLGLAGARAEVKRLTGLAGEALSVFEDASFLSWLADELAERVC